MSKRLEQQLRDKEEARRKVEERRAAESPHTDAMTSAMERSEVTASAAIVKEWNNGLTHKLEARDKEIQRLQTLLDSMTNGDQLTTLRLDPALIEVKGFNRFASSFNPDLDSNFGQFVENIAMFGGNRQAGMVRLSPSREGRYELVFGERRLRACERAGVPFLATVADLSDDEVLLLRELENIGRKDKTMLERAFSLASLPERLEAGKRSALISHMKISATQLNRLRAITEVPLSIWSALPSPHLTTAREAAAVVEAYREDPDGVQGRLDTLPKGLDHKAAIRVLVHDTDAVATGAESRGLELKRHGRSVQFKLKSNSTNEAKQLEADLRAWLAERGINAS